MGLIIQPQQCETWSCFGLPSSFSFMLNYTSFQMELGFYAFDLAFHFPPFLSSKKNLASDVEKCSPNGFWDLFLMFSQKSYYFFHFFSPHTRF